MSNSDATNTENGGQGSTSPPAASSNTGTPLASRAQADRIENLRGNSRLTPAKAPPEVAARNLAESFPSVQAPSPKSDEAAAREEKKREHLARMEASARAEAIAAAYTAAGVPARNEDRQGVRVVEFRADHRWASKLDAIASRLGKGAIVAIVGPRGTGKSQLACELIRQRVNVGKSAKYCRAMGFFQDIKSAWKKDGPDEAAQIRIYTGPSLLVIDEAQVRSESKWENDSLTNMVDIRYGELRDTIFIANLVGAEFLKCIGESIADRLRDGGGVVTCDWESFRGTK